MEETKKKKGLVWILSVLISYVVLSIGETIGLFTISIPINISGFISYIQNIDPTDFGAMLDGLEKLLMGGFNNSPFLETLLMYLPTIGTWISGVIFMVIKPNRPILKAIGGKCRGNNLLNLLFGLLIGAGMNAVCILAAWLNGNIVLRFDSVQILPLIVIFIAVFIQSSSEELICRGILYQLLGRRYKPWFAIVINSLFFALLHIANPGVGILAIIDIFVCGLVFSLMVYYFDSIWCAFAAHAAWNFTQNIIFGLPNSGLLSDFSIFKLNRLSASNTFAYNVEFGVEGTVLAILVEAVVGLVIFLWGRKYAKKPTDIWGEKDTPVQHELVFEEENITSI